MPQQNGQCRRANRVRWTKDEPVAEPYVSTDARARWLAGIALTKSSGIIARHFAYLAY